MKWSSAVFIGCFFIIAGLLLSLNHFDNIAYATLPQFETMSKDVPSPRRIVMRTIVKRKGVSAGDTLRYANTTKDTSIVYLAYPYNSIMITQYATSADSAKGKCRVLGGYCNAISYGTMIPVDSLSVVLKGVNNRYQLTVPTCDFIVFEMEGVTGNGNNTRGVIEFFRSEQ